MRTELDKDTVAKAYARWAPVYDLVFGKVFDADGNGAGSRCGDWPKSAARADPAERP